MPDNWAGIAETTIRDYIRDVEDDILRNRKLLAMMRAKGRITFNHSGTQMDWKIRYKRALPKGYADMDTQTFPRRNRHKTATLEYRGYSLAESISKLDKLKNRGVPAIVKVLETKVESMVEDMEEFFGDELYIDGGAAGNGKRIHGIESIMGNSGVQANGFVASPSATYAGISTALGNYGGAWTASGGNSTWPIGKGDANYDFFSPTLVDYTNASWQASTKTWPNTCIEAMRFAILKLMKNKSEKGRVNMVLLENELYRQFIEAIAAKERIVVQRGSSDSTSLTGLGFGDVTNFEGTEVTSEFGMPVNTGYLWNMANMELRSMQSTLFMNEGPFDNEEAKTTRFSIDFFGNMMFRPRYFGKLFAYS